ncbi:MAG: hypothetical protein J6W03_07410 [Bacteroidaceae bacterium]|nr:hypothetical protein [Bacteroidaceae bacterium]
MLKDYVPENFRIVTDVNLRKPKMQHKDCPQFCPDEPIRMPLGFKQLFYDMPGHLERDIKNYFINLFSRRRYYDYHCGRRPITPDVEQLICQALLNFGWQQEPIFDAYTEEYQL